MKDVVVGILERELRKTERSLDTVKKHFAGKSSEEMNSKHGNSEMTPIETLGFYAERVKEIERCIEWVKQCQNKMKLKYP